MNPNTQERIDKIMEAAGYPSDPMSDKGRQLLAVVTAALREQDRDTRHACAEAVSNVNPIPGFPNVSTALLLDAYDAVINTQAV